MRIFRGLLRLRRSLLASRSLVALLASGIFVVGLGFLLPLFMRGGLGGTGEGGSALVLFCGWVMLGGDGFGRGMVDGCRVVVNGGAVAVALL